MKKVKDKKMDLKEQVKSSRELLNSIYKDKLKSKVVQFLILAAQKKGGKIKVTNFLLAINGFDLKAKDALEENELDLMFFGSVNKTKNLFLLDENINKDISRFIDYDKPIITNLILIYIILGLVGLVILCVGVFLLPIVLVLSIQVILIMAIYKKNLREPLLYVFALITIVFLLSQHLRVEIF